MNWFEKAFCQNYLDVYAHRTDEQARVEVEFANQYLKFNKNQTVLDLCCGAGRHAFALSPLVKTVVGFDLSLELLHFAVKENLKKKCTNIFWQKGDMRQLEFRNSFDAAVCFFNSLGYFENEDENQQVIQNVFLALKPHGKFLIDIMNKPFVTNNLIPESEKKINQLIIKEKRCFSANGLRIEKEVKIYDSDQLIKEYQESVRVYSKDEISALFEKVGFSSIQIYGDLNSNMLANDSSRLFLIAQKI